MRKSLWTGTCTAIVGFATAALIAQTPQTPQNPQTPPAAAQASTPRSEGKVTVTGCLKAAPPDAPAAAGTTGTAGTTGAAGTAAASTAAAAAADAKFLLTDASSAPAAANDQAAPPAAPAAAQPGTTYRLIANPSALTPHVGKKLALTGTIEKSPASPATASTATDGTDAPIPALRVESGKVLADTCTGR